MEWSSTGTLLGFPPLVIQPFRVFPSTRRIQPSFFSFSERALSSAGEAESARSTGKLTRTARRFVRIICTQPFSCRRDYTVNQTLGRFRRPREERIGLSMASSPQAEDVHPTKLFTASCLALLATSVSFAVVSAIMQPLKEEFILTNEQVGYIGGAQLWGFALAIFVFGPLCDVIGMRRLLRFALLGHFGSVVLFYFAQCYWMLIAGALSSSLGNGLVEAACNPLVATLYPGLKTEKLNHFHVWFPGGILIGGVAAALLDGAELSAWRLKL